MFRGIRSRTFGIFEHESRIVSALFHQRERHGVIFLRLGMKTGEDIRCQSAVGDDTFDSRHPVQIPFAGILAVHQLQNAGTTALHGQVDMLAHIGNLRDHFKRFIAHILRMGGRETDTYTRSRLRHSTQQHRESDCLARRFLKTVGVDVLSQQCHLLITFRHQVSHFVQDTLYITATLAPASIGHDTVGTEVVATAHDGHESGNMVAADTRRNHIPISFGSGKFHIDRLLSGFYSGNQIGQCQVCIRPHHEVYVMIRYQIVLHPLGHTSQYAHNQVFFLFLQRMEELQTVQDFLLRIVTDRTSVHKHGIGLLKRFRHRVTRHLHH